MIDPRELFVDPDPARAETLPPAAFTDPAFLARELDTIFARSWLLVPEPGPAGGGRATLAAALSRRGAQLPFTLLGRPLFLQRDWKGKLHAFPNVCTHAWHTLVEGAGRERHIVCPQHGRQFECDGRFRLQPGFERGEGFPRDCDHLRSLPLGEAAPHHYLCFDRPRTPLRRVFAPLARSIAGLGVERWERAPQAVEVREVEGNWKLHAWNFLDRFHIGFVHRAPGGLADAVLMPSYRTELFADSALQWVHAARPEHGFDPELLPARFRAGERRVFALWWFVFPNLALNFYPWGLSVNAWFPVPGAPSRTAFFWYHWVRDPRLYARRDELWLSAQVDAEDVDALAQVARGAGSGFAPRGRFAPEEERAAHWFHRLVAERVAGG